LGDVLGAAVVVDPAQDEREDPLAVARVQLLERPIVAASRIRDQPQLGTKGDCGAKLKGLRHASPQRVERTLKRPYVRTAPSGSPDARNAS
jgi:hypothetical protein